MVPSRRSVLRTVSLGALSGVAGCMVNPIGGEFNPEEHVDDWQEDPVRGSRPAMAVDQDIDVPPSLEEQCGWEAENAVEAAVTDRIGTPSSLRVDYTKTSKLPDEGWLVIVYREMILGSDSEVRETPDVAFETIHEATPSRITTTVRNGDAKHTCSFPVYVGDTYQQMD